MKVTLFIVAANVDSQGLRKLLLYKDFDWEDVPSKGDFVKEEWAGEIALVGEVIGREAMIKNGRLQYVLHAQNASIKDFGAWKDHGWKVD